MAIKLSIKLIKLNLFCILFAVILPVKQSFCLSLTEITHLFDIEHDFKSPSDVAVSNGGNIYVLDGVNNCVKVFDNNGRFNFSFGKKGREPGEFNFPLGIGIDKADFIYIADSGNHRIQIFSPDGEYISKADLPPKEKPADPTDISVDRSRNRIYAVDNDNHRIQVYELSTLRLVDTFGRPGTIERTFNYPFLMDIDKDGYLYIVETINTRIQVLNPEGKFVAFIGGWGVEKGEFFRPKGVASDKESRIFASDSYLGVIQIFNTTGQFLSAVGDSSTKKIKKFLTPTGIFIDNNNKLYVVEMLANKVSVHKIKNDTQN